MSADNFNVVRKRQDGNGWDVWLNLSASCDAESQLTRTPAQTFKTAEEAVKWADAQGYTEYGTSLDTNTWSTPALFGKDTPKVAQSPTYQPMQPVEKDAHGVVRFRANAIVRHLLDHGNIDLNQIARLDVPQEDREQFAQLIGYSIHGYHELSYVSDESAAQASELAHEILPDSWSANSGGCRDAGCPIHGGPLFDADGKRIT